MSSKITDLVALVADVMAILLWLESLVKGAVMESQILTIVVLFLIGIASSCVSIFMKGREVKKKDQAIKQQEKIIRRQKKRIKELKTQTSTNELDKDKEPPQEKLPYSQEYVLKALSFLISVDPFNRTLADDELESVHMDSLEEIGIPIYLLQGSYEIGTCKKLIEELGLDEGLKRIKEKGTDLVFI